MAEKYGDSEVEDKCREKIRTVFQSLGEYVKAKEYYETALAIAEKNGDWETEATCCERLGSVFQFVGEYIKAKQYYEKAVAIVCNYYICETHRETITFPPHKNDPSLVCN